MKAASRVAIRRGIAAVGARRRSSGVPPGKRGVEGEEDLLAAALAESKAMANAAAEKERGRRDEKEDRRGRKDDKSKGVAEVSSFACAEEAFSRAAWSRFISGSEPLTLEGAPKRRRLQRGTSSSSGGAPEGGGRRAKRQAASEDGDAAEE